MQILFFGWNYTIFVLNSHEAQLACIYSVQNKVNAIDTNVQQQIAAGPSNAGKQEAVFTLRVTISYHPGRGSPSFSARKMQDKWRNFFKISGDCGEITNQAVNAVKIIIAWYRRNYIISTLNLEEKLLDFPA